MNVICGTMIHKKLNHRDTEAQRRQEESSIGGNHADWLFCSARFSFLCLSFSLLSSLCLCVSVVQSLLSLLSLLPPHHITSGGLLATVRCRLRPRFASIHTANRHGSCARSSLARRG